jgi:hypothetical protein
LRTIQEAGTLKPRKLNFKAFGAITVLSKKSQILLYINIRTVGGQIKLGHLKFNLCKSDH